jgi:glyoxylase-like metal-dependent hydrolase (beta-lactamase superfamily II)
LARTRASDRRQQALARHRLQTMATRPVVELAPGVWRIPLLGDWINGFALRDTDGQLTLIDFGLKGSAKKVLAAVEAIGAGPTNVTRILLTHAHPDHAGGAAEIARRTGHSMGIHADDAAYLAEGRSPPRDASLWLGRMFNRIGAGKFEAVPVGERLTDGQLLPVSGGLRVIHTPGHSPGHVAFHHEPTGVLITGDSIFNVLGMRWSIASFCTDFAMSKETAQRLMEVDYTVAAFTHGPEIRDNPRQAIGNFLAKHRL